MPEEVIQSTFTSTALNDLFPLWTEDPSKARPICMARFGTGDQAVDWTQTNVNNPVEKNITDVGISVITGDSTTANVRVAVEVTNSTDPVDPMRGQVLKEMGLFIDDSANPGTDEPVWKMIWVSKLPDMRVPTLEESGITMSFLVTVPIKFDNSDQIHLITDNAQLETRMDNLENAMGEKPSGAGDSTLWQYVQTMNGNQGSSSVPDYPAVLKATRDLLDDIIGSNLTPSNPIAKYINKLNSTSPTVSKIFGDLSNIQPKADYALVGARPSGIGPVSLWESVGSRGYADQTDSAANSLWGYVKRLNGGTLSDPRTKADYDAFVDFKSSIQNGIFNSNKQAHGSLVRISDPGSAHLGALKLMLAMPDDNPVGVLTKIDDIMQPAGSYTRTYSVLPEETSDYYVPILELANKRSCTVCINLWYNEHVVTTGYHNSCMSITLSLDCDTEGELRWGCGFYRQHGLSAPGSSNKWQVRFLVHKNDDKFFLTLWGFSGTDNIWKGTVDIHWL